MNIDVTDDVLRAQELEHARKQLEHDSRHDALTGLANRRLLNETAALLLETQSEICVMHLDLDYFKIVNDTLGHAAGDAVLVHVAQTLGQILRGDALICRFGGDEFAVLFDQVPMQDDLTGIAQRIIDAFKAPFLFEGHACIVGISIGSARGGDTDKVFAQADIALYAAKDAGRSCYLSYKERNSLPTNRRFRRRQDLVDALANDKIECWYQPQFDARTKAFVGAEALARLRQGDDVVLAPDEFLPLAQETGLFAEIEGLVFQLVLEHQTAWYKAGLTYPAISINLSHNRLAETALADQIGRQIKSHHAITLELLETAFLDDPNAAEHKTLSALRDFGLPLELDDFGSGHASIVALGMVKPERVKIDQRLIRNIPTSEKAMVTLNALISIARAHNADVVLEGIETNAHLDAVRTVDCDVLQGYALGAPMTREAFEAMLGQVVPKRVGET